MLPPNHAPQTPNNASSRQGPYLPPMPELWPSQSIVPGSRTSPRGSHPLATPRQPGLAPAPQYQSPPTANPANSTRPHAHSSSLSSNPKGHLVAPADSSSRQQPATTIRGRLDEGTSVGTRSISLPPPEALGLLPRDMPNQTPEERPNQNSAAASSHHQACGESGGNNLRAAESLFNQGETTPGAPKSPANKNGVCPAGLDWSAVKQCCEQLGATSYRLERLEDGRWRFTCALPGQFEHLQREVEAIADSEGAAVSAVLDHLMRNRSSPGTH
ncbi:hypothetical protein HRbin36_02787 [bacterium HR36]|nr:hypothetical protein HRbin36_02787 [bacterium HR36]